MLPLNPKNCFPPDFSPGKNHIFEIRGTEKQLFKLNLVCCNQSAESVFFSCIGKLLKLSLLHVSCTFFKHVFLLQRLLSSTWQAFIHESVKKFTKTKIILISDLIHWMKSYHNCEGHFLPHWLHVSSAACFWKPKAGVFFLKQICFLLENPAALPALKVTLHM